MSGTNTAVFNYYFKFNGFILLAFLYLLRVCIAKQTVPASNNTETYAPPCNVTSDCFEKRGFVCYNGTCVCMDGLLLQNTECFGGTLCVKESDPNCTDTTRANCTLGSCSCHDGALVLRKPECLGRCDTSKDCHIEVGYSCSNGICRCVKGLQEENGQCLIGGQCQRTSDCQAVLGSICVLKECTCPYGQKLSRKKLVCIPNGEDDGGDSGSGFPSTPLSVANLIITAATVFTASRRFI